MSPLLFFEDFGVLSTGLHIVSSLLHVRKIKFFTGVCDGYSISVLSTCQRTMCMATASLRNCEHHWHCWKQSVWMLHAMYAESCKVTGEWYRPHVLRLSDHVLLHTRYVYGCDGKRETVHVRILKTEQRALTPVNLNLNVETQLKTCRLYLYLYKLHRSYAFVV